MELNALSVGRVANLLGMELVEYEEDGRWAVFEEGLRGAAYMGRSLSEMMVFLSGVAHQSLKFGEAK